MTSSRLPRRAVVGAVLAASIVGGGLAAAFADDPAAGCQATYTDPAKDAAPFASTTSGASAAVLQDDDVDILAVTHDTANGNLTTAIKLAKLLATGPDLAFGDAFETHFTVAGKAVDLFVTRDVQGKKTTTLAKVAGTTVPLKVTTTFDVKASTVTLAVATADLTTAVGGEVGGAALTKLSSRTASDYLSNGGLYYDTATAPADKTYVVGTSCGGGTAAAPAAADSPSPAPSASSAPAPAAGGPAAAGPPLADCFTAKDPKGDAKYGVSPAQSPVDPDLDILGLTLGTTADALVAYFKVDKLAAGPSGLDGHRFAVNFTFNKHNFTASGSAFKDAQAAALRDGLAATGRVGKVTQLAVDGGPTVPTDQAGAQAAVAGPGFVASGLKYTFDVKTSTVSMSLPLADIEKYGKAPTADAMLLAVYASAAADSSTLSLPYDTVPDGGSATASKLTYSFGDNACFGAAAPAASPLSNTGAITAQYGDAAAVSAKLVDAAGAPVAGKDVTFALPASTVTATTGADGVASAALPVKDKAGTSSLVLTSGDAKTTVDFTVLVEKTVLKATGGKGAVTATLTDDDKAPVAGQVVTFTSGSKKVTAKTNAKGVATAKGLPPGNVKVAYAGAAGMYSAASTSTKD